MQYLDVDGARLAFTIDGPAHLPWLILSNSLATDHRLWDPQLAALTQIRRVVRYDTRGHGKSSAATGPYDFKMLCGDVVAVLDHLGIPSADVLGLSLGGMTALGLCLDHADRINRAICCCARADFPAPMIQTWDDRIKVATASGMGAIAEGTLGRWFTEAAAPNMIEHARTMILGTSVAGYCGCAAALKGLDYRRRLAHIARPILYVAGQFDLAAAPDAMRDMADATPDARFEIVPASAHLANLENVAYLNQAICEFLSARPLA